MRIRHFVFAMVSSTQILAMDNVEMAQNYTAITTDSSINDASEMELVTIALKNNTNIALKIRGRFGPTNKPPIGFLCEEAKKDVPQIFQLNSGQAILFAIKKKYLPLRVRVWRSDFEPDSDMDKGLPIDTSKRNHLNTLLLFEAGNNENSHYNKSQRLFSINESTQNYFYKLERRRKSPLANYKNGIAYEYISNL